MIAPPHPLFGGLDVVVSDHLPLTPSDGAIAKRIVRHGLAHILEQLGEEVGPKPEAKTHVLFLGGTMHVSITMRDAMRDQLTTKRETRP